MQVFGPLPGAVEIRLLLASGSGRTMRWELRRHCSRGASFLRAPAACCGLGLGLGFSDVRAAALDPG